jgi:methyl-accepting chemotaxis protein
VSQLDDAMKSLQTNIMTLKEGRITSGVELEPLPSEFFYLSDRIDEDWNILNRYITDYVASQGEARSISVPSLTPSQLAVQRKNFESLASNLVESSDVLVTNLRLHANINSQNLILLQIIFGILNIVILLLVLCFVARILKPIPALTQATSEIEKGNLNISVKQKGNDELSVLGQSFNSMVNSLARYKSRQNELTMHLESKMMN